MLLIDDHDCRVELITKWAQNDTEIIQTISSEVSWRNDKISFFGKTYDQPRKVAWHGDHGVGYRYSGIDMLAKPWSKTLKLYCDKLNAEFHEKINSVLVNLYRDGRDYMSWHSDDEKELGDCPKIFSLSFGAKRDFIFKHRYNSKREKIKVELGDGDLLIMSGKTQEFWHHALPKRLKVKDPRLNLTFRTIRM